MESMQETSFEGHCSSRRKLLDLLEFGGELTREDGLNCAVLWVHWHENDGDPASKALSIRSV